APPTNPTTETIPSTPADLVHTLATTYPGHQKPPIVLVHGWQGANIGLPCQRHDDAYVDDNWGQMDEYLSTGETFTEPTDDSPGGYVTANLTGLGFHVEIAHIYSGGAIDATGPEDPNWNCTPVAELNVPNLIEAIDTAKADTGQDKVILISHSMGGLVSRAYLEGSLYRDDVVAVFTLGTPNIGVPVPALQELVETLTLGILNLADYCRAQAVVCQFSDDESDPDFPAGFTGIETFNAVHNQRATGVTYHMLGGDAAFDDRGWIGSAMDAIITGPDDGIVPLASALGESSWDGRLAPLSGPIDRAFIYPAMHIEMFTDDPNCAPGEYVQRHYSFHNQDEWSEPNACLGSDFLNRHIPSSSFLECLAPTLWGRTNGHVCGLVTNILTEPDGYSRPARIPSQFDTLMAGETAVHTFYLAPGPAMLKAHGDVTGRDGSKGQITAYLVSPTGQRIDIRYATQYPNQVQISAGLNGTVFLLHDAQPGPWQLHVTATAATATGFRYAVGGQHSSPITIAGHPTQAVYQPNQTATLTAHLTGPAQNSQVYAIINSHKYEQKVPMTPVGDGRYHATFTTPNIPGYAQVTFFASGTNTRHNLPFHHSQTHLFTIASDQFQLTNSYRDEILPSLSGIAPYNDLAVHATVKATSAGTVGVSADLLDSNGRFLAHTNSFATVTAGTHNITLRFRGHHILPHNATGPYTLDNIRLIDYTHNGTTIATANKVQLTTHYTTQDFTPTTAPTRQTPLPIDTSPHICVIDNTGPYLPNDTINLTFNLTTVNGTQYPEWLDYYFVNAPDAWNILSQSPAPPDNSGWSRPTTTTACNNTGLAFWGQANHWLSPLPSPCLLAYDNLPLSGSMAGLWAQTEWYDVYQESFEGAFPPPGWQMVIESSSGGNQGFQHNANRVHSGTRSAMQYWHDVAWYQPDPKTWLITPRLSAMPGDRFYFWQNLDYAADMDEQYLYMNDSVGGYSQFRDAYGDGLAKRFTIPQTAEDQWVRLTYDITDYGLRDDVYFALYYEADNGNAWYVDDFGIERQRLADTSYTFNVSYIVADDPANSCPGSPYVGVSSDINDERSSLVGVAMGDLIVPSINSATCSLQQACPLPTNLTLTTTVSTDGSCPGTSTTTIPVDAELTFCYTLTNNDTTVTVADHTITNSLADTLTFSATLAPGASTTYSYTTTIDGTANNCYDNNVSWTGQTPLGLGQPQGAAADVPFIDTRYSATANPASAQICLTPQLAPQLDISIGNPTTTAALTWTGGNACFYDIHYLANDFYFEPNPLTLIDTLLNTATNYNAPLTLGDPADNYSYLLRAYCGTTATTTNRVGQFDYTLTIGN
ncbi:MAG TPA: choice-of-anchor J domain-containing protein, partial [Anaerolineae bacterium]|nr:choice-of-anchor J domain-containing protein [Anaerolineae bacterium]